MRSQTVAFPGSLGAQLAARLELPLTAPRAYAIFAHCFTCGKDSTAAVRVARALAAQGFAVLRFDFTGLGKSEGSFAQSTFSSNVADLLSAAEYLRANFEAPSLLIGHSLGGAAVLAAGGALPEVRAIATIGAPAEVAHVAHHLEAHAETIAAEGQADVQLGGRALTFTRQFLDDLSTHDLPALVAKLHRPLLVLHAPRDEVVGVDNASKIFVAAKHPKSFVSLDGADHLLLRAEDAQYAADLIAAWAARYLPVRNVDQDPGPGVLVEETGTGKFIQRVRIGAHDLIADEPIAYGGEDAGPSPYQLLSAALGACKSMTLRMYASRNNLPVDKIAVRVRHQKIDTTAGKSDLFNAEIALDGDLTTEQRTKLLDIADRCAVHRTLTGDAKVKTQLAGDRVTR
jgi:putative redox protein